MENIINTVTKAFINVYGLEKWQNLTQTQKHDVIMTLIKDFLKLIEEENKC